MEIIEKPLDQVMFLDNGTHYEFIFMDDFQPPSSSETADFSRFVGVFQEMKDADHSKELHIFVNSYGGSVDTLAMMLQQITQFHYRVGVCCGIACSCGCDLLFSCHERYVSPFCQILYHDISISQGREEKVSNALNFVQFSKRWSEEIERASCIRFYLTDEEIMKGKTSDVFLTGRELISRGACKDYSEYVKRGSLKKSNDVVQIGGDLWKQMGEGKWKRYSEGKSICSTEELLEFNRRFPGESFSLKKLSSKKQEEK